MSQPVATEVTETGPADTKQEQAAELPADHPLVKTLAAQKTEIKDLKARTKRLDEIEEAQKTQSEKDADRVAKAEAEAATVPAKVAEALKIHLVALHEIDAEDADLFLTATDPELLLKQIARLLGQTDKRPRKNHVSREGQTVNSAAPTNDLREFADQLFGGGE